MKNGFKIFNELSFWINLDDCEYYVVVYLLYLNKLDVKSVRNQIARTK